MEQIQKHERTLPAKGNYSRPGLWKVVGGTALVLALAGLIVNLPDIKRYIRISTM